MSPLFNLPSEIISNSLDRRDEATSVHATSTDKYADEFLDPESPPSAKSLADPTPPAS